MAGDIADFFDVNYKPLTRANLMVDDDQHVIGTNLFLNYELPDGNGVMLDLSSGFTASMTCKVDGVLLATFTETASGGRQILMFNHLADYQILVGATPTASTNLFGGMAGKNAICTLVITRTSDGAKFPIWRRCYIPLSD